MNPESHSLTIRRRMPGPYWTCSCGEASGRTFSDDSETERDWERHVREAIGLEGEQRVDESSSYRILAHIKEVGHVADAVEMVPAFGEYLHVLGGIAFLYDRKFVEIEAPNPGDDTLLSARGISITNAGKQALQEYYLNTIDVRMRNEGEEILANVPPLREKFDSLEQKREGRALFMKRMYELTDGNDLLSVDPSVIGLDLGWKSNLAGDVARYLLAEGLLRASGSGIIGITHDGVREVEKFLEEPDEATEHFPSMQTIVNMTVQGDFTGQQQIGTVSSQQTQANTTEAKEIAAFLHALTKALEVAEVDDMARSMAVRQIEIVSKEIEQGRADSRVVFAALPILRDFAVNVAASGAFLELTKAIANLHLH